MAVARLGHDDSRTGDLLASLAARERGAIDARRLAIVVAHPDDETIGIGAQLIRLRGACLVHVTDGAPVDMQDAVAHGFPTREAYAAARRWELVSALAAGGMEDVRLFGPWVQDQRAAFELTALSRRLADLFAAHEIECVLTHPYEGGHPDHEATAFAVHAAAALVARDGRAAPSLYEMAFYHLGPNGCEAQCFAPHPDEAETVLPLDEEEWQRKQRMIERMVSQQQTLAPFQSRAERFRAAPHYDFTCLPNGGRLYYAQFEWGMTGALWQRFAAEALQTLGLDPVL